MIVVLNMFKVNNKVINPDNTYQFNVNKRNSIKKVWKMFKVNNKDAKTMSVTLFWDLYCKLWTYFTLFPMLFMVDFEQVNVCWYSIIMWGSYVALNANFEHIQHDIQHIFNKFAKYLLTENLPSPSAVLTTLSKIYDGAFFWKYLTALSK